MCERCYSLVLIIEVFGKTLALLRRETKDTRRNALLRQGNCFKALETGTKVRISTNLFAATGKQEKTASNQTKKRVSGKHVPHKELIERFVIYWCVMI